MMVGGYQNTLALAWAIGGPIGNLITSLMVRALGVPSPKRFISSAMNYPYYIMMAGAAGSYHSLIPFAPACSMLFIYGLRKPFMFHSDTWITALNAKEGCKAVAFK